MRKLFLIPFLLCYLAGFSQQEKKLLIGAFKTFSATPLDLLPFSTFSNNEYYQTRFYRNYGLNIGFEFNNTFGISLEIAFMNLADGSIYGASQRQNMRTVKGGLNLSYRFIKDKTFSPKVGLRGGFIPFSDIIGKIVDPSTLNAYNNLDIFSIGQYIFESWSPYGNIDLMLSVRINNFDLEFGGEINYLSYSLIYKPYYGNSGIRSYSELGVGLKIAVLYMIPFSHQQKSKKGVKPITS